MPVKVRRIDYFYVRVEDVPGEAYKLLSMLADLGLNLLAFTAIPIGPEQTQLTLFPEDAGRMSSEARKANLELDGPHRALLVQGDDELGALASIHAKLYEADVNVFASSGVTDGQGSFGYILYIRPDEYERAAAALSV
jgi:hypothetical protein